jgi:hypothetical protein
MSLSAAVVVDALVAEAAVEFLAGASDEAADLGRGAAAAVGDVPDSERGQAIFFVEKFLNAALRVLCEPFCVVEAVEGVV